MYTVAVAVGPPRRPEGAPGSADEPGSAFARRRAVPNPLRRIRSIRRGQTSLAIHERSRGGREPRRGWYRAYDHRVREISWAEYRRPALTFPSRDDRPRCTSRVLMTGLDDRTANEIKTIGASCGSDFRVDKKTEIKK